MPRLLGLLVVCCCFSGCGTEEMFNYDAKPVNVSGKVTYRGYIVNGGWIVFSPDPDHNNTSDMVTAEIMSDGSFQVIDGKQHGLHPGNYRMTVSNHRSQFGNLPKHYADSTNSGLKCTVVSNQPLRLRIELD